MVAIFGLVIEKKSIRKRSELWNKAKVAVLVERPRPRAN